MASTIFLILLVHQVFHVAQLCCRCNQERISFGTITTSKDILDAISFTFGKEGRITVVHGIILLIGIAKHNRKAARSHCRRWQSRRIRHRTGRSANSCRGRICTGNDLRVKITVRNDIANLRRGSFHHKPNDTTTLYHVLLLNNFSSMIGIL